MHIGIVLCSRTDSKRLPGKPFLRIGSKSLISHLINRLAETGLSIFVAVPEEEKLLYEDKLVHQLNKNRGQVTVFGGTKNDPLRRMYDCARAGGLDHVVRVCHDKVFVDCRQMHDFIETYLSKGADYIYSTNFIDGMGFEIFSVGALERAVEKYLEVEDVSFAIMAVAEKTLNLRSFPFNLAWLKRKTGKSKLRLLIDYKKDLATIQAVMARLGEDCAIEDIISEESAYAACLPHVSVYTCSYNDHEHLGACIESVLAQAYGDFEYVLVDDGSQNTAVLSTMQAYAQKDPRIRVIRNETNIGLASSSNVAIKAALGRYVMRMDADDYFINKGVLGKMVDKITSDGVEILYPDNLRTTAVQKGYEAHHVGGALFRKKTIDFLRFTDGLRHFDGADIYKRAIKHKLKIGYYNEIAFYYRQRSGSLSQTLSFERRAVAEKLEQGIVGKALV